MPAAPGTALSRVDFIAFVNANIEKPFKRTVHGNPLVA